MSTPARTPGHLEPPGRLRHERVQELFSLAYECGLRAGRMSLRSPLLGLGPKGVGSAPELCFAAEPIGPNAGSLRRPSRSCEVGAFLPPLPPRLTNFTAWAIRTHNKINKIKAHYFEAIEGRLTSSSGVLWLRLPRPPPLQCRRPRTLRVRPARPGQLRPQSRWWPRTWPLR